MLGEAIIAALLALGAIVSLQTGKTLASGEWRIPYIANRRKDPLDFWLTVIVLSAGAGLIAVNVAIHQPLALLAPAIGDMAILGGVALVPKSFWRAIPEFFAGPPAEPAAKAKVRRASGPPASVAVRGRRGDELQRIIADFSKSYELPDASIEWEARTDGVSILTVSDGVAPENLCFLVNYLNYPNGFDLSHRSIDVLARAVLPRGFGPADLVGKGAFIYVPSADAEYDLVYVRCDGKSYKVPFTDFVWRVTSAPRMPAGVSELEPLTLRKL